MFAFRCLWSTFFYKLNKTHFAILFGDFNSKNGKYKTFCPVTFKFCLFIYLFRKKEAVAVNVKLHENICDDFL